MHLVLGTPQGSSNKQSHLAPFCKAPDTTPNPMLIPLGGVSLPLRGAHVLSVDQGDAKMVQQVANNGIHTYCTVQSSVSCLCQSTRGPSLDCVAHPCRALFLWQAGMLGRGMTLTRARTTTQQGCHALLLHITRYVANDGLQGSSH